MRAILKTLSFLLSLILVFASFFLAGSGQDLYFYAACGFALAGILVFIIFMRERKTEDNSKIPARKAPDNVTEDK